MEANARELTPRQKKVWLGVLCAAVILVVGLVVAIVVVVNTKETEDISQNQTEEQVKYEDQELKTAVKERNAILSTISKVLESSADRSEEKVVSTYQYYISEEDDELVKLLLRLSLVMIEVGYDTDKTRGDELITAAKEIDEELQTMDSAITIMNMATTYKKNDLYEEYKAILMEREKAAGIDRDDDSGVSEG